jgi:hypothetical protein
MAKRHKQLLPPRTWTSTDFAALRAFVQRVPPAPIVRLYLDPETAPHAASADAGLSCARGAGWSEHSDLQSAAGELVAALWAKSTTSAQAVLEALRADAEAEKACTRNGVGTHGKGRPRAPVQAEPSRRNAPERAAKVMLELLSLESQGRYHELLENRRELQALNAALYAAYMKTR